MYGAWKQASPSPEPYPPPTLSAALLRRVFTHSSLGVPMSETYETLEAVGDRLLGAMVWRFVAGRHPTVDPHLLNVRRRRFRNH